MVLNVKMQFESEERGSQGTREDLLGAGNIFDLDSDVGNRGRFIIKCIKL